MTAEAVEGAEPIGQTVGNYKIIRKISVGGMGAVYYAEHALIGRSAAIKVLHPELSGSKELVDRFFNEAKATTSIKHPGIVEIFDYGYMPGGDGYIIMEFLEGMSLAHRLDGGARYGEGEAALLMRGVCSALAAAHAKGIVHRDLKPDNIFLVDDPESPIGERPKILDFGIAKLTDIGVATSATRTGAVMGTPIYMSPEQCRGAGQVDQRADIYSLGCILYELVCGRPPFTDLGAGELIGAHLFLQPDPPSAHRAGLDPEMEALIMRLLDKKPENRVQSAAELSRELARIATQHGYVTSMTNMTPPAAFPRVPSFAGALASSKTELAAASQSAQPVESVANSEVIPPRRSLRRYLVPALALLAAAAIAVFVFRAVKSDDENPRAVESKQAETKPVAAPTPPAPPPVEEKPVEEKPVEEKPVDEKPAVAVEPPPSPVTTKPKPRPAKPKPKPVKPKPVKPKPTAPQKPKPILETDI